MHHNFSAAAHAWGGGGGGGVAIYKNLHDIHGSYYHFLYAYYRAEDSSVSFNKINMFNDSS